MTNYIAKLNLSMMNKVNAISICINSMDYIASKLCSNMEFKLHILAKLKCMTRAATYVSFVKMIILLPRVHNKEESV